MKTKYLLLAGLFFGLSFGASAQEKKTVTTESAIDTTVTEISIETDQDTDSKIERAASNTGSAVKSGASKTGSVVKKGAEKTGSAAKKGGKTVAKGARKGGKAVSGAAKEGVEETKQHTPGTDAREQHKAGERD